MHPSPPPRNCAEVKIERDPNYVVASTTDPTAADAIAVVPSPTNPPVADVTAPATIPTSSVSITAPAPSSPTVGNVADNPPSGGSHGKTIVGYYAVSVIVDSSGLGFAHTFANSIHSLSCISLRRNSFAKKSWQWYDRSGKAAPENMDFTKLQRGG